MIEIGIEKSKEELAGEPRLEPLVFQDGQLGGDRDLSDDFVSSYAAKLNQQYEPTSLATAKKMYRDSIQPEQADEPVELDPWSIQASPKHDEFGIPLDDWGTTTTEEPLGYLDTPGDSVVANAWNSLPDEAQQVVFPFLAPFLKGSREENPIAKGVVLGTQNAAQGILDLGRDVTNALGGEFNEEDWLKIPQILDSNPDSGTEAVVAGLSQFMSVFGALGGMSKGAGLFKQMWTGGFADSLFDPEEGNIGTLLRELDVDNELTEFWDSKVGEDASAEERLLARAKTVLEGATIGFAAHYLVQGFKKIKQSIHDTDPDLVPRVLEKFGVQSQMASNIVPNVKGAQKVTLSSKDFKRNKDGTYVGFSKTINTPQKLNKLIAKLNNLANEGTDARMWYENSSKAIMDLVGGDVKEAEKLAQIIAITSQSTNVKTNTGFAFKAYAQHKAGLPIESGRFPASQSKRIEGVLNGIPWEGRKTNSFYRNLMVEIDPDMVSELKTTQDMWMARAFGLDSDAPGPAQYENMEKITTSIAEKMGWSPHQAQAAIWVAVKGRFDPVKATIKKHAKAKGWTNAKGDILPQHQKKYDKYYQEMVYDREFDLDEFLKASYDYSDGIQDNLGNIALEAVPGRSTNVLPGIHNAKPEEVAEFTQSMYSVFLDENGADALAKDIGILAPDNFLGFGGWAGDVNPSVQVRAVVSGTQDDGINAADEELLDLYARVVGTVFKQEGVAYRRAFKPKNWEESNGVHVQVDEGRTLTRDETAKLYKALEVEFGDQWTSPIPSHDGVELINFGDLDNKVFYQKVKNAIIEADLPNVSVGRFRSEGKLIENNWELSTNGQDYGEGLTGRSSDLYRKLVDKYGQQAEEVRQTFAEKYNWDKGPEEVKTNAAVPIATVGTAGATEANETDSFIKSFEDYKATGYHASTSEKNQGIVTVGYGSTRRVKNGEKVTKEQAEQFFQEDLAVAEKAVDRLVKVDLTPNQRSAVVSLVFNVGEGNFKKSKALKALNSGDFDTFIKEAFDSKIGFVKDKKGGKILKGLVKRREAERKLFEGGTA